VATDFVAAKLSFEGFVQVIKLFMFLNQASGSTHTSSPAENPSSFRAPPGNSHEENTTKTTSVKELLLN
jgi:hypothetical protein